MYSTMKLNPKDADIRLSKNKKVQLRLQCRLLNLGASMTARFNPSCSVQSPFNLVTFGNSAHE